MTKKEAQARARAEKLKIKKRARLRKLRSDWILFTENGYYLWTACTECGNMANCRGKTRDAVKCRSCHMEGLEEEDLDEVA